MIGLGPSMVCYGADGTSIASILTGWCFGVRILSTAVIAGIESDWLQGGGHERKKTKELMGGYLLLVPLLSVPPRQGNGEEGPRMCDPHRRQS